MPSAGLQTVEGSGTGAGVTPAPASFKRVNWRNLADEDKQRMRDRWLEEKLKGSEDEDERNYFRAMAADMQALGEWYRSERERCKLIPASTNKRGRPNTSGHMSRETMVKLEERLRQRGRLDPKPAGTTNGKIIAQHPTIPGMVVRTRGIKVVRAVGTGTKAVVRRVLAWFSFFFGREFRPSKYKGSRSSRSRPVEGQEDFLGCLQCHRCDGTHEFFCRGGLLYPLDAPPLTYDEEKRLVAKFERSHPRREFRPPLPVRAPERRRIRLDYGQWVEVAA